MINNLEDKKKEIIEREYNVLCVNAPSTNSCKVALPGDPVCLYYALSTMLDNVTKTKQAIILGGEQVYPNMFPRIHNIDSLELILMEESNLNRDVNMDFGNCRDIVFDPRVCNVKTKSDFIN